MTPALDFCLVNATVVTPEAVLPEACLRVEDGVIAALGQDQASGRRCLDVQGRYVLPGFIDLHSDAIEKVIEPRPRCFFPANIAILEMDRFLAACGVTTIFHALSFAEGEIGVRSNRMAADIIKEIHRLAPVCQLRTKVHARYEITDLEAVAYLEPLVLAGQIHLLSFMDHTPGQGQFREITSFKHYFGTVYKKGEEELEEIIDRKRQAQLTMASRLDRLASLCRQHHIPLSSHDDDSRGKIQWLYARGVRLSEFPVNQEALAAAKEKDVRICLGAPNVLRGNSQANNLSARQAIAAGFGDILCSDYAPQSLVHSVFLLPQLGLLDLAQAVRMVSLNPARAVGLGERLGSLEVGKEADLILVDAAQEVPRILATWVRGKEVYRSC
jgi:alpha-D-ribose 1-methylphosphonate 5-triphosphate diphosphatase